ncbi:MAG: lamin tail domain-containing protein, partial [Planctomycetota bacterium]
MRGSAFGSQSLGRPHLDPPAGSNGQEVFADPGDDVSNTGRHSQVLINEIMYHPFHQSPAGEDIRLEYIELFNSVSEAVNMSGWRLSGGVDFEFPDVTLSGGHYLIVAADVETFTATYPGAANVVGGWDGKLSNSGETIELVDRLSTVVDRVRYADEGDWAVRQLGPDDHGHRGWIWSDEHDGGGRSLELINPAMPNEYGQDWAASLIIGGTPGAVNSVAGDDVAPLILDVAHWPIFPGSDDSVTVSAHIMDESTAGITAVVYFRRDGDASFDFATMFDDGAHGDGDARDGTYGAEIPAQSDGTIVEF